MFTHRVIPYLKSLADGVIVSRTLKLFGIGESSMEAQLREEMEAMTNPTLAPYAKEGECELRITAKAADEESARALIAPVEERLRARFGPLIYGADVPSLEAAVFQLLKEKGLTLGCAESCTGGLIAKRMTDLSGVSAVFRGGVVSYATEVKHTVLGVEQALLDEFGAVSEPVARAMAEDAHMPLSVLNVDGGAAANDFLMQFQSDILGSRVVRPQCIETTALGAAYLAGLAVGVWKSCEELQSLWHCDVTFEPTMEPVRREKLLHGWHKAVGRSLDWEEH